MTTHLESNMIHLLLKPFPLILLIVFFSSVNSGAGEQRKSLSTIETVERKLELGRHQQLAAKKSIGGTELTTFTTDGCSAGLSVGWTYLADKIERVESALGVHPPWEPCCIEHDKLYHIAGDRATTAIDSFVLRKEADSALKMCVLQVGVERTPELTAKYNLSEQEVEFLYKTISSLMYHAVRVGGVPCSGLPWRWGYGWPECD